MLNEHSVDMTLVRQGSLFWLLGERREQPARSLKELPKSHGEKYPPFFHALLENGIYMAPSGYEVGFLSYAHTDEVLGQALDGFRAALKR